MPQRVPCVVGAATGTVCCLGTEPGLRGSCNDTCADMPKHRSRETQTQELSPYPDVHVNNFYRKPGDRRLGYGTSYCRVLLDGMSPLTRIGKSRSG